MSTSEKSYIPSAVSNKLFASTRNIIYFTASSTKCGSLSIGLKIRGSRAETTSDKGSLTSQPQQQCKSSFMVGWCLYHVRCQYRIHISGYVSPFQLEPNCIAEACSGLGALRTSSTTLVRYNNRDFIQSNAP
jgi:hypothetical protein